ncbi:hypothetical protein GA0115244_11892 [Streptomyces sp. DvalAA-19]|nr:hypothetical protein GA0115244_11892 [Streptomyces sp. DvalAA-19]
MYVFRTAMRMIVAILAGSAIALVIISPAPRSATSMAQILGLVSILIIVAFLAPSSRE